MKIQSKFTDYYDKCTQYGIDELIIYKRIPHSFIISNFSLRPVDSGMNSYMDYMIRPFFIYFCDNLYKGLRFEEISYDFTSKHGKQSFYTEKQSLSFLDNIAAEYKKCRFNFYRESEVESYKVAIQEFFINKSLYKSSYTPKYKTTKLDLIDMPALMRLSSNYIKEYNVPYVILYMDSENRNKTVIEFNSQLSLWDFNKVKNPIEAFQELSMYVGGVLNQPSNEMIKISNESMVKKKGFDHKYAFRKEPTKHKN